MRASMARRTALATLATCLTLATAASAAEPLPTTYWDVKDVRPGMKGVGRTVMVGTKLEEFQAEVLGVMKDVSPGRDMILCRLEGCRLEHSGIIQGMSGSPIYIDGKLLGAVAYAWEFAKDPIAGVTPFSQMVRYARSSDRRLAAEAGGPALASADSPRLELPRIFDADPHGGGLPLAGALPQPVGGGGMAGMKPIATPLAASGFGPRAMAFLEDQFAPLGMAPMAGGEVQDEIFRREADKPLEPGSPLTVALVTGDFDLSAIGTVTHVEGDRVFGFGHPMMSLGSCEFPMMTGYIHTVYPRASVSMKMGSPLKVVGVLDTDVSTGIAGRIGPKPDMLPMSVKVKAGRYSEPTTYHVEIVRHPKLMPGLIQAVLANAIDTEGDLPEELTARIEATVTLEGQEPITLKDTVSGRFGGPMGPSALFGPVSAIAGILARNALEPVRITNIDCQVEIESGRTTAAIESVRLASDRIQPGEPLRAIVTLKPHKAERQAVEVVLPLPEDLPEGTYEAVVCDLTASMRRRSQSEPYRADPRSLPALLDYLRLQAGLQRSTLFLHVPVPERGLAVGGQALTRLPGSVRAVLTDSRQTPPSTIKAELIQPAETKWVVEGSQTLKFRVARDTELSLRAD
jgi:hypothetical protein